METNLDYIYQNGYDAIGNSEAKNPYHPIDEQDFYLSWSEGYADALDTSLIKS